MLHITLDHANSLYVATFDETLSNEEFIEEFRQMVAYPTYNKLVDLRSVKHVEVSHETLGRAIGMLTDTTQQVSRKIAVVAPSDVAFGMARTYEAMRPPSVSQFHVFREIDEAMEWLTN